jgi:hypothetical protein
VQISEGQKKPAIKWWNQVGLRGSVALAQKFSNAEAFGFCLGPRSRLTILDVDTNDQRVLEDALIKYGKTPIIVRSASGNYQAWYRHDGERRLIRPFVDKPIDILGQGFVVAPPSRGIKSSYQFIEGGLDDLDAIPAMRGLTVAAARPSADRVSVGARNKTLWAACMRAADHCDNLEDLLDVARTRNDEFSPPLPDDEVVKVAHSAWGYTERGLNRFGKPGAFFPSDEANRLIETNQDGLLLLVFLSRLLKNSKKC